MLFWLDRIDTNKIIYLNLHGHVPLAKPLVTAQTIFSMSSKSMRSARYFNRSLRAIIPPSFVFQDAFICDHGETNRNVREVLSAVTLGRDSKTCYSVPSGKRNGIELAVSLQLYRYREHGVREIGDV